jgi:hypothetical protein
MLSSILCTLSSDASLSTEKVAVAKLQWKESHAFSKEEPLGACGKGEVIKILSYLFRITTSNVRSLVPDLVSFTCTEQRQCDTLLTPHLALVRFQ